MLPASTQGRTDREAARGKQQGRTVEIQRLIGRSLRQAANLEALAERQITLDCDVLNGTRCAAITGAWVALVLALRKAGLESALVRQVAAVSAGVVETGEGRQGLVLDLEYEEDHLAAVDANLVVSRAMSGGALELVEYQTTGEGRSFRREEAISILDLALNGCERLMAAQLEALG
jgi:ribonuclease PH